MKTLITKGVIGLLGASGLSLGGYYGYKTFNNSQKITKKDKVGNFLKSKGYVLLSSENTNIPSVLENYKRIVGAKSSLGFAGFTGVDIDNKPAKDILIEQCNLIFEKENSNNSDDLKKVRKWCVEPITVTALLKKSNINSLETGAENSEKPKITQLDLTGYSPDTKTQKIKDIKAKCLAISTKTNYEEEFDNDLEIFKLWCADN